MTWKFSNKKLRTLKAKRNCKKKCCINNSNLWSLLKMKVLSNNTKPIYNEKKYPIPMCRGTV